MKNVIEVYLISQMAGTAIAFFALLAFVIVGIMTAGDLSDEQNAYCKAVHEQTYPDYKKTFEKSCKEWLTEQNKSVN